MKCLKYFISNVGYIFTCHPVFVETVSRPRIIIIMEFIQRLYIAVLSA